jgi:hypothetical protein
VTILLESKNSVAVWYITFSDILKNGVSNEVYLQWEVQDYFPFLYRSLTFGYCVILGKFVF